MNKYLTQKFSNLKLGSDSTYSPLNDDADISACERTPKSLTPKSSGTLLHVGRKLLQNNKSFKIHKRSKHQKNKKNRLRNMFQEIQNKMQTFKTVSRRVLLANYSACTFETYHCFIFQSQDLQNGFRNYQNENKTQNCTTPNRKIRHLLGRTPTKLYSPFSIETPPPSFHWRREFTDRFECTPVASVEW